MQKAYKLKDEPLEDRRIYVVRTRPAIGDMGNGDYLCIMPYAAHSKPGENMPEHIRRAVYPFPGECISSLVRPSIEDDRERTGLRWGPGEYYKI